MKNKLWLLIFTFFAVCPGKSIGNENRSDAVAATQQSKEKS